MHVHVHVHVCVCVCVLLRRCRLRMQVMPWRCTRTARARARVCVCACVHTCPLSPTPSPPGSTTFAARVHTTHHAPHANTCTDTLGTATLQTCLLQKATSIGLGGQKDVLTGEQITALYKQMGITDNNQLQLCYNPKLHGYSSSTMHDRCDNKGKTFTLMRRNANGRVFGGFTHITLKRSSGWIRGNPVGPWLFAVRPKDGKVEINLKYAAHNYVYYFHNSHFMTWGGGHDLYFQQRVRRLQCQHRPRL